VDVFDSGGGGSSTADNVFVTLAHFSALSGAHQLVTESDFSGTTNTHHFDHGTAPLVNSSPGTCSNPTGWDTNGGMDPPGPACDIPNWLNYGFRGSVSPGTNWADTSWNVFRCDASPCPEPAPQLTAPIDRASCRGYFPTWVTTPSCPTDAAGRTRTSTLGDWLETVAPGSVNLRAAYTAMTYFIQTYGRGAPDDKSIVVNVFVWDCAQHYGSGSWTTLEDAGDCSQVTSDSGPGPGGGSGGGGGGGASLDRLHVVAVVPMTINENDVRINPPGTRLRVSAHWGGLTSPAGTPTAVFGDAGACSTVLPPGCPLNPLMNSAFLVPGE
jgi:hypothetical protein